MRAASTACTVAGTWIVSRLLSSADSVPVPAMTPVSISDCTLSSRKKGLPPRALDQHLHDRCQRRLIAERSS